MPMMRKFWLGFLLLCSVAAQAHEFETFPWLVKVSSTYTDPDEPQLKRTFTGHGFVIEADRRSFVITSSHLSQGGVEQGKPTLSLEYFDPSLGKFARLPYRFRIARNRRDIEVIEITKKLEPLAYFQEAEDVPIQGRFLFPRGRLKLFSRWADAFSKPDENSFPQGYVALGLDTFLPNVTLFASPLDSSVQALGAKKARELAESATYFLRQRLITGLDSTDAEYVSAVSLHPGMSGLPLIIRGSDSTIVGGVVTSSSRSFESAWFSPHHFINYVLEKARRLPVPKNPRLEDSYYLDGGTVWRCKGGLLYRWGIADHLNRKGQAYEMVFQEALFQERSPTGNGTRSDGGNGTRSDGGGPGATLSLSGLLKSGVSFYVNGSQPIEAVAYHVNTSYGQYLLPGEMASLNWIIESLYKGSFLPDDVRPVRRDDALAWLMWERWTKLLPEAEQGSVSLNLEQLLPLAAPLASKGPVKARVLIQPKKEGDQGEVTALSIAIDLGSDRLEFTLGRHGELTGQSSEFTPEIEVKSSRQGKPYKIDLSSFLMTSPSVYNFEWDHDEPPLSFLRTEVPNPQVRFRVHGDGAEYLIWGG